MNLRGTFAWNTAGTFLLKVASAGLSFLISLILARRLGAVGYGAYSYAIALVGLLAIPAIMGLDRLLIRNIASYQVQSAWGMMKGLLRWANGMALILSLAIAALSFLAGITFAKGMDRQMLSAFLVALILLPILTLTRLRQASLQGLHKIIPGQLPELLLQPALFIILLMASYLSLRRGLSVELVLLLHITAAVCAFVVGAWLLYTNLPQDVRMATPTYHKQTWIVSATPLFLFAAMQTVNSQADIILLGAIKGAKAVGIYSAANRLAALISVILIAVNTPLAPTVARLYAEGDMKRLQEVITKTVRLITLVSLPLAGSMLLFGDRFLLIFSSEFLRGRTALSILSIGQIFNATMGSVGLILTMTGYERYAAMGVGISAVLNIILNACFIPLWGMEGAALATSISMIALNIALALVVKRKLGINSTILQRGTTG